MPLQRVTAPQDAPAATTVVGLNGATLSLKVFPVAEIRVRIEPVFEHANSHACPVRRGSCKDGLVPPVKSFRDFALRRL